MTLEVEGLTVRTEHGAELLHEVSWSIEPGGRLGVIGASGSGKSLSALAVLGLLPEGMTVDGSIRLDGVELVGASERSMRRVRGSKIAMVFQEPLAALDPLMRVERLISGPVRLHRALDRAATRKRVHELLDLVSFTDHERILRSFPWQLSGGQRQRISLAMALAAEPEVLLADEPTTALDMTIQREVLDVLDEVIDRTGTALVFITHDLAVASRVARELIVMRDGIVVERGLLLEHLAAPSTPYLAALVAAARAGSDIPELRRAVPSSVRPVIEPDEEENDV